MELRILGTGTTIPVLHRGTTGYALVASGGEVLVLDCGPGSTRRWPAAGFDLAAPLAVLNTHHHADHCADLAIYLFGRNVVEPPLETPVTLFGPKGHGQFVHALGETFASGVHIDEALVEVDELVDGDVREVGPFRILVREVAHIPHALGVRVEADGVSFAFSGDSGPCRALEALCRDVDLALLECSYAPSRVSASHLNPTTAAEASDIAAAVREAGFGGRLTLAEDLMRIPVTRTIRS